MGQLHSFPATEKTSVSGENEQFLYAISAMQGWRPGMDDAHAAVLDLDQGKEISNGFFAVYDGHAGSSVAKFAAQNVHKRLSTEESYQKQEYETALKRAFLGTDEDFLADPARAEGSSGCTAIAALITHDRRIFVANAGDSRSVLSVKGEANPLSFDHKPTNPDETARITKAGGHVWGRRVNGNLALSRALGDFKYKKNLSMTPEEQIVTANPDVSVRDITEEDEFLVIACDGIWDCLTSQQAIDFVRIHVSQGKELVEICEMMCDHCLAPDKKERWGIEELDDDDYEQGTEGIGCDNMTVLIVALLHGRTKEEWYNWVTDRVKQGYGYQTPPTPHRIYSESRLKAFKERCEARARGPEPKNQKIELVVCVEEKYL